MAEERPAPEPEPRPIRVDVTRRAPEEQPTETIEAQLESARMLADLLDTKFNVGGIRFGLDSILGLVPVVGDTLTTAIGLYPLFVARRHKLGRLVQARMLGHLAVDWAVGLIPLVGDLFDVGYKANIRNLRLLENAIRRKRGER